MPCSFVCDIWHEEGEGKIELSFVLENDVNGDQPRVSKNLTYAHDRE